MSKNYYLNNIPELSEASWIAVSGRHFSWKTRDFKPAPVLGGATSLWETEFGASDFHNAGSLCHAWSSVMPYYCGSKVLGITPLEPGFGKFSVQIYPGHLTHAEGSVPTPHGHIQVSWRLDRERRLRVAVRHPENLKMEIAQYEEFPVHEVAVL